MGDQTIAVFLQQYEEPGEKMHQELLLKYVVKYYTQDGGRNLSKIIPIIERTSEVSLRLLDWFIVSYAKENDVTYMWQGKAFNVFSNYRQQLNHYSKKYFDAFRRHTRTYIYYENVKTKKTTDTVETTLGQLVFFKWCMDNGLIDYVSKNVDQITEHMKRSLKEGSQYLQSHKKTMKKFEKMTLSSDATAIKTTTETVSDYTDGTDPTDPTDRTDRTDPTDGTDYTTSTSSTTKKRNKSAPKQEHPRRSYSATRYFETSYTLDFS
jgi:hypothetical protein